MRRLFLALSAMALVAAAPRSPERLPQPAQEARAHSLFRQIRCLVCQNESIDDSDAALAADLRGLVRQDIVAGRSDPEIKRALVDRYGEFVLLRPRFSLGNAALWLLPLLIVAGGGAAFALRARRPADAPEPPLTEAETSRVAALASTVTVPPQSRPTDTIASG